MPERLNAMTDLCSIIGLIPSWFKRLCAVQCLLNTTLKSVYSPQYYRVKVLTRDIPRRRDHYYYTPALDFTIHIYGLTETDRRPHSRTLTPSITLTLIVDLPLHIHNRSRANVFELSYNLLVRKEIFLKTKEISRSIQSHSNFYPNIILRLNLNRDTPMLDNVQSISSK